MAAEKRQRFRKSRTTRAVQGALICLALATGAANSDHAQAADTVSEERTTVRFEVPAGPLATAMSIFASDAGINVSAAPQLVQGKTSAGVTGSYSVADAFARLLAGTALEASRSGGSWVIHATTPQSTQTLPTVTVADVADRGITEHSGSYTTRSTSSATRMELSLRDTPQAVTVMTRERIEEQGLQNITDVIQNTPGITVRKTGPERSSFYARGFSVDNIMYDGLPTSLDAANLSQDLLAADMAMYDRVEIVRGASGLMQGAGSPSAAINMIRKKPTRQAQVNLNTSVGSWDRYRAEIDASGPLNEAGSLRGRLVSAYQKNGSFRDRTSSERSLVYGVLEADVTRDTTIGLTLSHQEDNMDGNGWSGLPVAKNGSDLGLPRSTSYSNDWEYWNKAASSVLLNVEQRFDNDWKLRMSAYKSWARLSMMGNFIYMNTTGNFYQQFAGINHYDEQQSSYDIYANGPFQLLGLKHELVLGIGRRKVDFDGDSNQGLILNPLDLYHFTPSSTRPNLTLRDWLNVHATQTSGYATTRLNVTDSLKLILGGRLDWYDYQNAYPSAGSRSQFKVVRNLTKYAGIVYDLDTHHSVYASYTDIFKPQAYYGTGGKLLAPIVGKNYELGIKGDYFDGALNASLALFVLDQTNRAKRLADQSGCISYPTTVCYEAAGEVRSQGIDVEIQGAITPQWQLAGGYTYSQAKYRNDATVANIGQLFDTDVPRHLLKMSTLYRFAGDLSRWRAGASMYWQNTIYNKGLNSDGTPFNIVQKGYALVDLVLGYKLDKNIDLQLNINNVFDKHYYNALANPVTYPNNVVGDPRNFMLAMRYSF
jgi:outer membrane receptor for ferric coprogen and ferric-rhodotorulic acid